MSTTLDQWKVQLGSLPVEDRAELAQFLLSSLEDDDKEIEAAWEAEVSQRVSDIRAGRIVGRPAEELLDELRELYP